MRRRSKRLSRVTKVNRTFGQAEHEHSTKTLPWSSPLGFEPAARDHSHDGSNEEYAQQCRWRTPTHRIGQELQRVLSGCDSSAVDASRESPDQGRGLRDLQLRP